MFFAIRIPDHLKVREETPCPFLRSLTPSRRYPNELEIVCNLGVACSILVALWGLLAIGRQFWIPVQSQ